MTVEYQGSTLTKMDVEDSTIGYSRLSSSGSKLRYSVFALRNSPVRLAAVCLSVLCLLLLAGVIGQSVHYGKVGRNHANTVKVITDDKEKLQANLKSMQMQQKNLQDTNSQLAENVNYISKRLDLTRTNNQLLNSETSTLKQSESQLKANNSAMVAEIKELKSGNEKLRSDYNTLSTAKTLIQTQFNALLKRKNELQTNYDSVSKDRNNVLNKLNNMTRSREDLQKNYNMLVKIVEHLQDKYNSSASERDKIASSHRNATIERDNLVARYDVLVKARDELETSYNSVVQERRELEISLRNVTVERDELRKAKDNLTAERDQLLLDPTKLNTQCESGWQKFKYSCYYLSFGEKTWKKAREYCQTKNSDLAIITSQEEMKFINGLFKKDTEVWIGLSDEGIEGDWKWVDGTSLTTTFWGSGQPNSHNGKNQDCVEFWHHDSGTGEWNDENCNLEQKWLCER